MMIVVTGAAGFIGSCLVWKLNQEGITDLLLVDELASNEKWKNLQGKKFSDYLEKDDFLCQLQSNAFKGKIKAYFHLGACSSTTEMNASYLIQNNYDYSKKLATQAFKEDAYFCYASSAATYGAGEAGYSDDESKIEKLRPLNMYGMSKQMFDTWLLQNRLIDKAVGIKFFNVFGPNEYHKGDMRSLVCKAYEQIRSSGKIRLFESHHPDYRDGEQKRDFVYVKDAVSILYALYQKPAIRGIFNLGSGTARTWNDLARAIFAALNMPVNIEYIPMPEMLREKYQYFTRAEMGKIKKAGIAHSFLSLEAAVKDYVGGYLSAENPIL